MTLDKCLDTCRASEMTTQQLKAIDGNLEVEVEAIHAVKQRKSMKKKTNKSSTEQEDSSGGERYKHDCKFCGTQHARRQCPAFGKTCKKCLKKHHFASVCRNRGTKIHQIEETESEDSDSDASVFAVMSGRTKYMVEPLVKPKGKGPWKKQIFQLDNGAGVSCLKLEDCCKIMNTATPVLKESSKKLTSYSGDKLSNMGQITLKLKINGKEEYIRFQVVQNGACSLLNGEAAETLGLMKIKEKFLINTVCSELTEEDVLKNYKDVFEGLGDLGEYHIEVNPSVKPRQDPPRTVPVALKKELKEKLKQMEKQGVIQKITEPTDWINSMVAVRKPNKLRICLDPKELNKAVKIPKYKLPTLDDVSANLSKAKVFSVVDAKDGFLQVRLDDESSKLTTFSTPFGRYKWVRMPFGISSAPEEFQRRVLEVVEGLEGIETIADDILVYGSGDAYDEALADHDKNMIALLERCREKKLKLNKTKLRFKQQSVKYHGHIITSEGLKPDPAKVEDIGQMPRPEDKKAVKRLIGMINYLAKFCPHLSTVSEPLRRLTDEKVDFVWSGQHEKTFKSIQQMIASAPVLRYYSVTDEVTVEADSSDYGLGAVLLQGGQPVAYASRALSKTELLPDGKRMPSHHICMQPF